LTQWRRGENGRENKFVREDVSNVGYLKKVFFSMLSVVYVADVVFPKNEKQLEKLVLYEKKVRFRSLRENLFLLSKFVNKND
jgi:hypothetical protein